MGAIDGGNYRNNSRAGKSSKQKTIGDISFVKEFLNGRPRLFRLGNTRSYKALNKKIDNFFELKGNCKTGTNARCQKEANNVNEKEKWKKKIDMRNV